MEIRLKTTIGDKVLIVLLIVVSLIFAYKIAINRTGGSDMYISIQVNGEEIKTIDFTDDMIGKTYEIKTEFGRNVIEIGDHSVWVIEADCPDKLDVKQGKIDKPGWPIVCLPNRLIIEIKSRADEKEKIDNFAY